MPEPTSAGVAAPSASGLLAQRSAVRVSRRAARGAFWRMLGLVYPHRRAMAAGVLLGLGVALTYAASLGGMLPLLKVVVEQENLHAYLLEHAARTEAAGHAGYGAMLRWLAGWLPGPTAANAAFTTLLMVMGVLLVLNLAGNALRCVSQYLVLYAANRSMMDLRRRMYRKSLRVSMGLMSGEVSNRVSQFMSDAREVFLGVTTLFGKVAREPLKAACVLALALILDWRVTLVVIAIAPVAIGLLWYFGRKVRKATVRMLDGYGEMLGGLEETLQGIDVVKGYAREGHERRRMWQVERRMLRQLLKLAWIEAGSSPLIEVAGVLFARGGIVWLASQTLSQQMEVSHFMTMVVLLAAMLDPVRKVANVYNAVQRAGAAAARIFEFLDLPEQRSAPWARRLGGSGPRAVSFEKVSFRYTPQQQPAALSEVSLDVSAGECIALVGPNGSGKSTLLKLLTRLIDADRGKVTIDGIDVRDVRLRSLREQIAVVSQRAVIFARTARENIAYGKADATDGEVRQAARKAYADEFIEQLPEGYDTVLGEFGMSLSGGQRQRIAIARAFLKPASILVFDEATSEIDAESEHKIHDALAELRRGKTTFLIAHRHTVMDLADRIVVMDGGRIVDAGARGELLARCPLFAALYRSPAG